MRRAGSMLPLLRQPATSVSLCMPAHATINPARLLPGCTQAPAGRGSLPTWSTALVMRASMGGTTPRDTMRFRWAS